MRFYHFKLDEKTRPPRPSTGLDPDRLKKIDRITRKLQTDPDLVDEIFNSQIQSKCISFENLKINEAMPIIKNCNLCISNDTGWMHIASALNINCLAIFMDSPVLAYGKYSKKISVIIPEGETEESTTHNTRGKDKISFDKVFKKSIDLLN